MCVAGFICFRQRDLKSLVAYSSVVHMSLILLAIFSFDTLSVNGILGLMIAHGLCSSGLFYGVQICYEKTGSRSIFLNRGMITISSLFVFF